jgi:2-keto-4-pentenoate hydratase/2-oxohepta-3-ene-1,7-dioic acid hydratase in catechol pathway
MRLLTFSTVNDPTPRAGLREGKHVLDLRSHGFAARVKDILAAGPEVLAQLKQVAADLKRYPQGVATLDERAIRYHPAIPDAEKFLCVGKNYRSHLAELRANELLTETPEEPTAFVKLNSCLSGHEAKVARPEGITRLDYEPELVFVIGKHALGVKKGKALSDAFSYVAGVTILNDLTDRDAQRREVASGSRFWTGKNIPGFGPLGPEIITMDEIRDPYDLWMTCSVNGEQRMRVNTADQIWKLPDILEHFSRYIPIEPGDMFSTGAPGGVAVGKPNAADLFLKPGDVVECAIEGIATLRTYIT